jgi:hypothetical protein
MARCACQATHSLSETLHSQIRVLIEGVNQLIDLIDLIWLMERGKRGRARGTGQLNLPPLRRYHYHNHVSNPLGNPQKATQPSACRGEIEGGTEEGSGLDAG